MKHHIGLPRRQGLYDPALEHDACGVGFLANIKGQKPRVGRYRKDREPIDEGFRSSSVEFEDDPHT